MITFCKQVGQSVVSFIDKPANGLASIVGGTGVSKYGATFLDAAQDWEKWLAFFVTWLGGLGSICVGLYWIIKFGRIVYIWIKRKKNDETVFRDEDFD